jgi:Tfp pilus assembly protein PilO
MMVNRYITPLLVVAVAMGVYFLYISKVYQHIGQQLAQEQIIEGFLLEAQNARTELDQIIAQHRAFPPDANERLLVLLPDTLDPARLITDVNAVAARHGIAIKGPAVTLGRMDPDAPTEYLSHVLRFKITSTYPVFKSFLVDMEKSLAIRDFEGLAFKSTSFEEEARAASPLPPEFHVYNYEVELRTYSLR